MSSLPPELAGPVERLRAKLLEINGCEQTCMTTALVDASQGKAPLPETQAIMARCRQASAAAAAAAIGSFRHECSEISAHASSLATAGIVAATAKSVSDFWVKSQSSAAAFAAETAALLPAHGPDKTTQTVKNIGSHQASSINRYFQQLPN